MKIVMKRALILGLGTLALAGCSVLPNGSPQRDSRDSRNTASSSRISNSAPIVRRGAEAQCLAQLGAAGAQFDALPDRYADHGCSTLNTVQMHALQGDYGRFEVGNLGPVTCPVSTAFAAWARYGVDRAARQVFGVPIQSIQTMGSYSCRNVAGTGRRSAHASADAIDVGGFVLSDGRRISVHSGWNGSSKEREFLRTVQRSACLRFGTVLGPDYNAAHRDHFHVEGVSSGSSYCR